jgi:ABC-type uncharacterized transport system ATPase subunit
MPCGEFVAVIGANGAGKSTLLAALAGFIQPGLAARFGWIAGRCPRCRARRWRAGALIWPKPAPNGQFPWKG